MFMFDIIWEVLCGIGIYVFEFVIYVFGLWWYWVEYFDFDCVCCNDLLLGCYVIIIGVFSGIGRVLVIVVVKWGVMVFVLVCNGNVLDELVIEICVYGG